MESTSLACQLVLCKINKQKKCFALPNFSGKLEEINKNNREVNEANDS